MLITIVMCITIIIPPFTNFFLDMGLVTPNSRLQVRQLINVSTEVGYVRVGTYSLDESFVPDVSSKLRGV